MHTSAYTHEHGHTHACACTHEHGHACIHVHTHINTGTYTPTCIHTWIRTHRQKRTKKKENGLTHLQLNIFHIKIHILSFLMERAWNQPTFPHSYDHLEWRSPCFSSIALLISFYNVHSWISQRHWWWPIVQQVVKHPLHLLYTVIVLYSQAWGLVTDWMPDGKMKVGVDHGTLLEHLPRLPPSICWI